MMMMDWAAIEEELDGGDQGQSTICSMETTPSTGIESGLGLGMGGVLDFIKEDPIGVTIFPASLRPPPLTAGDDGDSSSSWVLLDLKAYIADHPNATTAKSFTRARHEIQATLCVARPPRVSYLCVHCPALTPADFGTEPRILAACDDLILFQAAICKRSFCDQQAMQDFFIYQAAPPKEEGGMGPSLTLLPHPGPSCDIHPSLVGLLCCPAAATGFLRPHGIAQQHYIIAALHRSTGRITPGEEEHYDLHRFHSKDGKWTTTVLRLGPMEPSPGLTFFHHATHKVITLGGGFMGWVDLRQGILLCNVLVDDPELHYISLPQLLKPHKELTNASAETVRDIAVVRGYIKYVEHLTHVKPWSCSKGTYTSDNWTAATCSWKINLGCWEGEWHRDYERDASHISGSLSKLLGYEEPTSLPRLRRLHTGHPTLSLEEDDVVYFLAKVDHRDDKAFVLAVNMMKGTLQGADYFGAERTVGISFSYTQSRISDYLKITPGKKEKQKKRPGLLLGSSSKKKPGVSMMT